MKLRFQAFHSGERLKGADEAPKELRFRAVVQAGLGDTRTRFGGVWFAVEGGKLVIAAADA